MHASTQPCPFLRGPSAGSRASVLIEAVSRPCCVQGREGRGRWVCSHDPDLLQCGAGVRSPARGKGHEEGARHTQRRDRASGVPLEILEHLPPKPESAYFLLCTLTYTSDFTGGCPPLPLSEKRVNFQLQLIIPRCDSVSTYKLLWKSSSLPE